MWKNQNLGNFQNVEKSKFPECGKIKISRMWKNQNFRNFAECEKIEIFEISRMWKNRNFQNVEKSKFSKFPACGKNKPSLLFCPKHFDLKSV